MSFVVRTRARGRALGRRPAEAAFPRRAGARSHQVRGRVLYRIRGTRMVFSMIDHISIAVRDLDRAARFYQAVLGAIGYAQLETRPHTIGFGKKYPELWLNLRTTMTPLPDDSGAHVALRVRSTDLVDAFHAAALA